MKNKTKNRLLLSLCCAFMFSAAPLGLSACGEPEGYDETGVYYCVVDGKEYVLSLSGEKFSLVMGESNDFGTYKYEGDVLTLRFDDEKAENTAKLTDEGVATVTINGTKYTFLKKVNYQVTYEVNGGSAVAAATVLNGKTLSKPADPTKEGYYFVGWYADAEFTTPFAFDATPITENITLYARFEAAPVGQEEYTVTFVVDGATNVYAAKKTVSGKVFDLPTLTKDGATFAGWWLSDSQDANKLTCKYDGQALNENTKLFAVWASNAPLVSVTSTGVTWSASGANNSYTLKITAPNESDNVMQTLGESKFDYDFAKKAAGEYVVEVTLGDNTTKVYYNNKQLADVSFFAVVEPSVLVFNAVENAEKYLITVDCGNEKHEHVAFNNGSSVYYNFANCDMQEGGIVFTVEAVADGYMTSKSGAFTYSRDLNNVTGLKVDAAKEQVSWNRVSGAFSYVVEVKKGDTTTKVNVGAKTVYSLKEYTGELTIKVYPVADGYNTPDGVSVTYTKATLATPTNVHFEGKTLVWNAVEGAAKYNVKIGAQVYETTTASYDLSNLAYATEYVVSVQAVGATEDKNSAYSDEMTVNADVMAEKLVYNKGEISWTPVLDADSYGVKVNGGAVVKVDGKFNSYAVKLTKAGANTIEVCAYYRGQKITDWVSTEVFAYEIEFDTRGGSDVASIYKAIGDKIELPTDATYEGYIFAGWYNVPGGPKNNGAKFEDEYYTENGNTLLYAYWTPQDYEVTLTVDEEKGTLAQTKATVYYSEGYQLPVPVSKDSTMTFGGWYAGGIKYTDPTGASTGPWNLTMGVELTAQWIDIFQFNSIDNGNAYSVSQGAGIKYVKEITVPATYNGKPVTTIEGSAFYYCDKLVTINIPDTIQLVAIPVDGGNGTGSPFRYCYALKAVNVYCVEEDKHNTHEVKYSSHEGVLLYHAGSDVEVKYVPYALRGSFTIPDGVTTIPINAFKDSKLSEVKIPASVTRIEETAFTTQYSSTTSYLTSVVFLPAAEGVDEKPLEIAANAFRYCDMLTSVTLPARITNFNVDIFTGCVSLAKIYITGNAAAGVAAQYASTEDGVLTNVAGDTIVYVPKGRTGEYSIPRGITAIGAGAFQSCVGITKVTIPTWVETIETSAFRDCTKLKTLVFEGTATDMPLNIAQYAFYNCTALTSLELPANLKKLEKYAFGSTTNLRKVSVCGANMELEAGAFGTNSATPAFYVTDLFIGKDVKVFEVAGVFGGESLVKVEVESGNNNYSADSKGVLFDYEKTTIVYFPSSIGGDYEIPDTVVTIGAEVFRNKKISSVKIGAKVQTIGAGAFLDCANLATVTFAAGTDNLTLAENVFQNCAKLTAITLPDRLVSIGDYAFAGTGLTTLNIPKKVEYVGGKPYTVFYGSEAMETVTVDSGNEYYTAIDGILYGKVEGKITTLYYVPILNSGKNGVVDIPKTVSQIGDNAFYGNKGVTEIKFSQGVEDGLKLGENALSGTEKLAKIDLPVGLEEITAQMFYGSEALTTVIVPYTVASIGKQAFAYCPNLTTVTFTNAPAGVTAPGLRFEDGGGTNNGQFKESPKVINFTLPARTTYLGSYTFAYWTYGAATQVEELVIPKGVTSMGDSVFYYANNIKKVTMEAGSTITAIPGRMFYYASALESFEIPDTVTSIGVTGASTGYAFYNTAIKSIVIPGSVTEIANLSFQGCKALKTVTFKAGTEPLKLNTSAFNGCSALEAVEIPARTQTIAGSVFANCTALASITFESGSHLATIGNTAFQQTAITSIEFPETLKQVEAGDGSGTMTTVAGSLELGTEIFKNCLNLTTVKLSSTVTNINGTFRTNTSIQNVIVAEGNKSIAYDSANHLLTDIVTDGTTTTVTKYIYALGQLPAGLLDENGTLTIPEGVKEIGAYAFQSQLGVKKVILPSTLTQIGDYAFNACSALETVEIADNSQLDVLGSYVFNGCKKLTSITLPDSLTTMGTNMFNNCSALTSVNIPSQITTIPSYTFQNCTALASFTVPTNVTTIGTSAFYGCKSLASITMHDQITSIGSSAFYNCKALTSVKLPASISELPYSLFYGCTGLTSIEIPANVKYMGATASSMSSTSYGAFYNCSNLTTVTFLSDNMLEKIGHGTFNGCSKLTGIIIPSSVSEIGNYAFQNCKELTSIVLPVGFTRTTKSNSIQGYVFAGCSKLSSVTFNGPIAAIDMYMFQNCTSLTTLNVPESVTEIGNYAFAGSGITSISLPQLTAIGDYAFSGAKSLSSITFNENQNVLGNYMFQNCTALTSITLPEALTDIPKYAFKGSGLTAIEIPERVLSIGDYAFQGCASLAQVNLGASLKNIGIRAFSGSDLRSVTIPENLETIGGAAFFGCENLANSDINVSSSNPVFKMDAEGTLYADNMQTIVQFSPTAELEGGVLDLSKMSVSSIATYAFYGCTNIRKLILPDTMKAIPDYAFYECTNLREVVYGNGLEEIGAYAFYGCSLLEHANLPDSVEVIYASAFEKSGVTSLSINGVVYLGNNAFAETALQGELVLPDTLDTSSTSYRISKAFYMCTGITSVKIPSNVTYLGASVFEGCSNLETVEIAEGLLGISGNRTFADCVKLKNLTVPSTCLYYYDYVFANTAIESFTFSAKLTSPGGYTFSNCKNLKRVVFEDGPTSFGYYSNSNWGGRYMFQGCSALEEVVLPNTLMYLKADSNGSLFNVESDAYEVSALKKIVIPASVTSIAANVFKDVPADFQVYCRGSQDKLQPLWASGWDTGLTLPVIWDYTGN